MLYTRDYKALSSVALPNLRSRRGGVALSIVCVKVYAAGSILGAKPLTQLQSCIGSASSVSSRFFFKKRFRPFRDSPFPFLPSQALAGELRHSEFNFVLGQWRSAAARVL